MNPMKPSAKDRALFMESLSMWDRPDEQLYGKPLASDVDVDSFIDRALSMPSAGVLKD